MSGSDKTNPVYQGWESSVTYPGEFIVEFLERSIENTSKQMGSRCQVDYLVSELKSLIESIKNEVDGK